ncbi:GspH/FimT family pseudopilin [Permianibacter aggregans]|uniref:GspH/FimT family pseudopilin n=1 Tax=Permianibacter aggregans TaxID=1510150 RepID=UPI0013C34ABE|nr:GspH/FimT family pseudopilin [Permianibacter aggregans]
MPRRQQKQQHHVAAFTLLELIITIIIIGVLAAVAAPIFFSESSFSSTAARDEMLTALRNAQQRAMADAGTVTCFITTSNSYSVNRACTPGADGTPIMLPERSGSYPRALPDSVTVAPATKLIFGSLGTTTATTFVFSGGDRLCVEASGYAYAC